MTLKSQDKEWQKNQENNLSQMLGANFEEIMEQDAKMKQKLVKILQRITLKAHQGQIGQNHYILEEINEKLWRVEEK